MCHVSIYCDPSAFALSPRLPRFLAFPKERAQFPRKDFVRCLWRQPVRQVGIQTKRGCPLEWTQLSPLGCLLYETNSSEKNCVLWASMSPNQADTPLLSALELTSSCSRVLSHDVRSSTILLWNDCHIVLADISLCLPTRGSVSWLREPGSTITLFGYLEHIQVGVLYLRCSVNSSLWRLMIYGGRHRVQGRPKRACQMSCQCNCPVRTWCSCGMYRCRRS